MRGYEEFLDKEKRKKEQNRKRVKRCMENRERVTVILPRGTINRIRQAFPDQSVAGAVKLMISHFISL